jgi:hypothetical protein
MSDPRKSKTVLDAILKMDKLIIADMKRAYEEEAAA